MKLYKTSGEKSEASMIVAKWSGALSDASKDRVAMKKDGLKFVETETIDVPTNKVDLLVWLNENVA